MRERRRFLLVAAAAVTTVSVFVVGAFGHAGNDDANAIHACVNSNSGAVYLVPDQAEECKSGFVATHWSIAGPKGEPGLSGYEVVEGEPVLTGPGPIGLTAACSEGKLPLGGGFTSTQGDANLFDSYPVGTSGGIAGWFVGVNTIGATTITPYAVCAYVAG
jgi:hypothetical protein